MYEQVLNKWSAEKSRDKQFVLDVGANTGYDTYGFAHLLLKNGAKNPVIFAFETEADPFPKLRTPQSWTEYKRCSIDIVPRFVGSTNSDNQVTLDGVMAENQGKFTGRGLVKIDVEGAEGEVPKGAKELLKNSDHDGLVEIHGARLIPKIAGLFARNNRPFLIKEPQSLPFIKNEERLIATDWLLTI